MATADLATRNGTEEKRPADNIPALYARLCLPMPTHKRTLGGRSLDYISGQQCIQRLNDTLGVDRWAFAITERWYEQDSDCCCVRGVLTVRWPDGHVTQHEDMGGQVVNRRRDTAAAIEIANDWKGARTDCLKRCAADVGIGLWLYGDDMPAPEADAIPPKSGAHRGTVHRDHPGAASGRAAAPGGVAQSVDRAPLQPLAGEKAPRQALRDQWFALEAQADTVGVAYTRPTREASNDQIEIMIHALALAIEQEQAARAEQGQLVEQEATY